MQVSSLCVPSRTMFGPGAGILNCFGGRVSSCAESHCGSFYHIDKRGKPPDCPEPPWAIRGYLGWLGHLAWVSRVQICVGYPLSPYTLGAAPRRRQPLGFLTGSRIAVQLALGAFVDGQPYRRTTGCRSKCSRTDVSRSHAGDVSRTTP